MNLDTTRIGGDPSDEGGGADDRGGPLARAQRLAAWLERFQTTLDFRKTLALLYEFGFSDAELAGMLDSSERSVRRWRSEPYSPTRPHPVAPRERADDLRALVSHFLADGTHDEWDIVSWLLSRRPELEFKRPAELVAAGEFEAALDAATQFLSHASAVSRAMPGVVTGKTSKTPDSAVAQPTPDA